MTPIDTQACAAPSSVTVVVALVPVMLPHRVIWIIAAVLLGGFIALGAFR
jgi:hypothetical protein